MTWGEQNTEEEAWEQLDFALAHGINFFDTGAAVGDQRGLMAGSSHWRIFQHGMCNGLPPCRMAARGALGLCLRRHYTARYPLRSKPCLPWPGTSVCSRAVPGAATARDVRAHRGDDWALAAGARLP